MSTKNEPLLDHHWAQSYLGGIGKYALHYLRTCAGLPHYAISPRKILYRKSEVDRWLAERAKNGDQATWEKGKD